MDSKNILNFTNIADFRKWLEKNHAKETECWLNVKKGKNIPNNQIWYIDAVEQVLCFGWIDTIHKTIDGVNMQKFTPRSPNSNWTELNKERCRRLEQLGLMTSAGRNELPDMTPAGFKVDQDIQQAFLNNLTAKANFDLFPALYQRVRIDSIQRDKRKSQAVFDNRLKKLIENSSNNVMFGEWNDYGRLINYIE